MSKLQEPFYSISNECSPPSDSTSIQQCTESKSAEGISAALKNLVEQQLNESNEEIEKVSWFSKVRRLL